jgi:hypothetical protein
MRSAIFLKKPCPQIGFRNVTQRLPEDGMKGSGSEAFMKRDREGLFLSIRKYSSQLGVTAADGENMKSKAAKGAKHVARRQLPQARHDASEVS